MSWAGIASNQTVSRDNLIDAVNNSIFTPLMTIPTGSKQITKSEAASYVNCSTTYGPFAAKSSNQLVTKGNLVARVTVNFYLNLDSGNAGTMDIYTASPAGAGWTLSTTLSTNGSSWSVSLLAGDAFYVTMTHTARANTSQRGIVATTRPGGSDIVQTVAGTLPKSVSSASYTLVNAGTYSASGLFGTPV